MGYVEIDIFDNSFKLEGFIVQLFWKILHFFSVILDGCGVQ